MPTHLILGFTNSSPRWSWCGYLFGFFGAEVVVTPVVVGVTAVVVVAGCVVVVAVGRVVVVGCDGRVVDVTKAGTVVGGPASELSLKVVVVVEPLGPMPSSFDKRSRSLTSCLAAEYDDTEIPLCTSMTALGSRFLVVT
ncbi:MAG: hypothetical protein ACLPQS_00460, partial [Acidimicrobiales bacterium]